MHAAADVVVARLEHVDPLDADPDVDAVPVCAAAGGELLLDMERAPERRQRMFEHGEEPVARLAHLVPEVGLEGRAQHRVVPAQQHQPRLVTELHQQAGRVDDVGEHDREPALHATLVGAQRGTVSAVIGRWPTPCSGRSVR